MKAKLISIFSILLMLGLFSSCSAPKQMGESDFFFWMDGYVAAPLNDEFTMSLTYYYQGKDYVNNNNVASFSFTDCNGVAVKSYAQGEMDFAKNVTYKGHSFQLKIKFDKAGVFQTNKITIHLSDGSSVVYPIGNWVFDIGELESKNPPIDTWSGVASSSNPSEFPYSFNRVDSSSIITSLQYGADLSISSPAGIPLQGTIKLDGKAPVKFIKAKLKATQNNKPVVVYAHGCYCGGMSIDDNDVQAAQNESSQRFQSLQK